MATDYSPLAGRSARGRITDAWLRGRPVVAGCRFAGERGAGAWLGGDAARGPT
jgi:hypothetical protein